MRSAQDTLENHQDPDDLSVCYAVFNTRLIQLSQPCAAIRDIST